MEKYRILKELGDGTCGNVYKALNMETYEIVAVKKMKRKFYFWEECINLREVKSLRKLNHPNIIKLKEIVMENNELFFIFEYMECNLYQSMKERQRPFLEEEIRGFMLQVLQGLAHMHKNGYFHRDLKPENLLVTNDIIKIADMGLAREMSSMPPFTDYVSTRWYRAPEILLQSSSYTPAIDMWAVGAILAELFTLCPIFPGESEADQLYKICYILGPPDWTIFPEVRGASRLVDISNLNVSPVNLSDVIPNASLEAIDLIKQLCSWDPLRRPTAEQCLQHPFFHVGKWILEPLEDPLQLKLSNGGPKPNLELNLWDFGRQKDDYFLGLTLAINPSPPSLDLFPVEMTSRSRGTGTDMFCSDFQGHSQQSVFWSLLPPDHHHTSVPVESSFSSIPHTTAGVPQSRGFPLASLQSNILDHPFLAMSSSFQQRHCV
ncbi:serine/threonine-protein kinase MHK isoform X1 [Nicotiana tomentosiformis]|uniref:serine/threonine-protein kinase MHK isoform X1 n=2 Tax=Nicotiana tomentosiformis TaxID=4098 RepID=UPI00051ABC20|nr:serine/threonine-protein kinase MHK isoform X1 [Nicotiana tomentosiformis]XP_009587146.1 serine/threonine-protein kinase MHK isoform X1 [Nicotiana tomentosiformis]